MLKRLRGFSLRAKVLFAVVVACLLGAAPAWSYWTASQSVSNTQSLKVGHLDMTTAQSGSVSLSTSQLYPGASVAQVYQIANVGSLALSFYANGWATGALGSGLVVKVTNASSVTGSFPSATCSGAQLPPSATALPSASPGALIAYGTAAPDRAALQPSTGPYAGSPSTSTICVQAALPTSAPSALQGQSSTVNVQFVGRQVAQP